MKTDSIQKDMLISMKNLFALREIVLGSLLSMGNLCDIDVRLEKWNIDIISEGTLKRMQEACLINNG